MRLKDADAFEANMQNEWERNEISNGGWIRFREMINEEPTISPQRWIPVSEKLPERNKMDSTGKFREAYLVTTGFMTFTARFNENGYWVLWGYAQVLKNIIAWMPLPDSYKEEE